LIGRNPENLIVGWCGRFLFFVVPRLFSQDIGDIWRIGRRRQREKIDWQEPRKFDCQLVRTIFIFCCPGTLTFGEWPENQIFSPGKKILQQRMESRKKSF